MGKEDSLAVLRRLNLPFDIDEVIPECHECVLNQLKKYKQFVYPDGKRAEGEFRVDCEGIKKNIIPKQLEHKYSPEELFKVKSMLDPVFFSEHFIINPKDNAPFVPRDYQKLVLRCTSPRQVLRWSRRTGKCISGDSKVLTKKGRIFAKDLVNMVHKPSIATFDEENFNVKFSDIYRIWSNGTKPVYKLKTYSGKETKITDNHPFFKICSYDGWADWIELKNLEVGDTVAVLSNSSLDVEWDEIKSIEYAGEEETFDLTVPETHTLIADDIISHNTASICVQLIHKMLTIPRVRIILAAPMIEQIENIFVRVRDFFYASPALKSAIMKFKRSPHELMLKNDSILKGFAAGSVARGGDGTTIRGQDADIVLIEEADYVSEQAFTGAIIPLLSTSPDTKLIAFSTPLGFTTTPFYKLCNSSPDYKEFHFTYRVLPWHKEVEKQRHNMTEERWNREYEASFADISAGVYKPKYIDRALTKYKYEDETKKGFWSYCMGVDWNEKHGAEIVVLGHNPHLRKFRLVEAVHVGGAAFTQLNSVAKVVEIYKKWRPDFMYVDSGNGSTNHELLLHMSQKAMPNDEIANLRYVVKKYDSGAKVEVRDIITGEKVKKAAKPFMVDASIRMFEQNRIDISEHDSVLEKQLRNYMIERYTETNIPKFGLLDTAVGDHRLDAFNLAVVAFQLEFADLFKREYILGGAVANNPLKGDQDFDEEDHGERGLAEPTKKQKPDAVQRRMYSKLDRNSLGLLNKGRSDFGSKKGYNRSTVSNTRSGRSKNKPSRSNF